MPTSQTKRKAEAVAAGAPDEKKQTTGKAITVPPAIYTIPDLCPPWKTSADAIRYIKHGGPPNQVYAEKHDTMTNDESRSALLEQLVHAGPNSNMYTTVSSTIEPCIVAEAKELGMQLYKPWDCFSGGFYKTIIPDFKLLTVPLAAASADGKVVALYDDYCFQKDKSRPAKLYDDKLAQILMTMDIWRAHTGLYAVKGIGPETHVFKVVWDEDVHRPMVDAWYSAIARWAESV